MRRPVRLAANTRPATEDVTTRARLLARSVSRQARSETSTAVTPQAGEGRSDAASTRSLNCEPTTSR
jgi:hypothetical protein